MPLPTLPTTPGRACTPDAITAEDVAALALFVGTAAVPRRNLADLAGGRHRRHDRGGEG